MSLEAITWALNHAPIPTHRRDASSLTIVLLSLANHADPDGRNAFPAVATLTRYTRLSERSVHYALRTLHELGLITPADPDIVAAHIKRGDRRPNGWDLTIHTTHTIHNPVHNVVHSGDREVQTLHPAHGHGVQTRPDGVQTTTPRGATTAPEPSRNHPRNRPARAPARAAAEPALPLPGICGQCDARPGDPISARILWLDRDRQHSTPCPRCHPTAIAHHQSASQPRHPDTAVTPTGDHTTTSPPATTPSPTSPAATAGPRSTRSPAHTTAHRGDTQ